MDKDVTASPRCLCRRGHLNPGRGVALGEGTPSERRERLRAYRWSSYQGYAGLEKMESFLDPWHAQLAVQVGQKQRSTTLSPVLT